MANASRGVRGDDGDWTVAADPAAAQGVLVRFLGHEARPARTVRAAR